MSKLEVWRRPVLKALPRVCDAAVFWGLGFLLVFAPFAFGSVHPWSARTVELTAFALLLVWAVRTLALHDPIEPTLRLPRHVLLPWVAFAALVALQLTPLPPGLLRVVSPATHAFYTRAIPDWPERAPYAAATAALLADAGDPAEATQRAVMVLPTPKEAEKFGFERFVPANWDSAGSGLEPEERARLSSYLATESKAGSWQPLSIAPAKTRSALVRLFAYLALFVLATGYAPRGGERARRHFERRLLQVLLAAGLAVAIVGLLQRFTWNGRILWTFVPWDWGAPRPDLAQTSGPFVNRNHFAGYLALVLPLAIATAWRPSLLDFRTNRRRNQWGFAIAAATIATAIVWSLSRGAWIASLVGTCVCIGTLALRTRRRPSLKLFALAALAVLVMILVPVDRGANRAGNDIDARIEQTLDGAGGSWQVRQALWHDSIPMWTAHPLFGVGLGAWGETFPRYDTSLRGDRRAYRAHNDYLQLACETGAAGLLAIGSGLFAVGALLLRASRFPAAGSLPVVAGVAGGVAAVALHEFVGFGLRVPGLAVSLAVALGLALRESWPRATLTRARAIRAGGAAALLALVGLCLAVTSPRSDRFDPDAGTTAVLAYALDVPTSVPARLELAERIPEVSIAARRSVIGSAIALDPRGPGPRDALAIALTRAGRPGEALDLIEASVARSPHRAQHAYLDPTLVRRLTREESAAIERGFHRAIPEAGASAAAALAGVHRDRTHFDRAAAAEALAAEFASGPRAEAEHLRRAGQDWARAKQWGRARAALETAISLDPTSERPYLFLIEHVLGATGDLAAAREHAQRAVDEGLDPFPVELALAGSARQSGDPALEREALRRAIRARPMDARGHLRLGSSYFSDREWLVASLSLRRAVEVDPSLAAAWYVLALSEERSYRFDAARSAFEAAAQRDPDNAHYRKERTRFLARLAANRE